MEQDCFEYVKKCHKCQEHSNFIHATTSKIRSQFPIWPFVFWCLDIIGKILPPSSARNAFIITTTNYLTKWVDAIPLRSTIAGLICRFILEHIISHFGLPSMLASNNGTPCNNNDVKKFLEKFNIYRFSTPYCSL